MINMKKYNSYYNPKTDKYYVDKSYPQKKSINPRRQKREERLLPMPPNASLTYSPPIFVPPSIPTQDF